MQLLQLLLLALQDLLQRADLVLILGHIHAVQVGQLLALGIKLVGQLPALFM